MVANYLDVQSNEDELITKHMHGSFVYLYSHDFQAELYGVRRYRDKNSCFHKSEVMLLTPALKSLKIKMPILNLRIQLSVASSMLILETPQRASSSVYG